MSKPNFVEYVLKARDKASEVYAGFSKVVDVARQNAEQFQAITDKLPLGINDLRGEIAALEYRKGFATTRDDIVKINTQLHTTSKKLKELENLPPKGFINKIGSLSEKLTGLSLKNISGMFLGRAAYSFVKESTSLFDVQAKAEAQVQSALLSTGMAAGRTFKEISEAATALQGKTLFGDEEVLRAQSLLLTFTNIKGAVFDDAMPAIADLAARTGTDLSSAVQQVGRALNEPAEGFASLRRQGIQFSTEQEESIKRLVQEGDIQAAQYVMLTELQKQFGGSAEAAAKSGLGPLKQLSNLWGDFREIIGRFTLNLVNSLVPALKSVVGWLTRNVSTMKTIGKVVLVAVSAIAAYKTVMLATTVIKKGLTVATLLQKTALVATTLSTQGLTKAMIVLNSVGKANVFGALVGVALAAVTAFQLFRKRTDDATAALENAKQVGQDYYAKEKMNLDLIFEKLKRTNPKSEERNRLVNELKEMYPDLNKQILDEIRNTNDLASAYDVILGKIRAKAELKVRESALEDLSRKIVVAEDEIERLAREQYQSQIPATITVNGVEVSSVDRVKRDIYNPATRTWLTEIVDRKSFEEIRKDMQDQLTRTGKIRGLEYGGMRNLFKDKSYAKNKAEEQRILEKIADLQFGDGSGGSGGDGGSRGTGGGTEPSKALDSITGGGKSMKQIYINIDNLVDVNNNNFTADQNPADASDFMDKLTTALQMIVNDTNYAI